MQTGKETEGEHEVKETTRESEGTTGKGGGKGLSNYSVIHLKLQKECDGRI